MFTKLKLALVLTLVLMMAQVGAACAAGWNTCSPQEVYLDNYGVLYMYAKYDGDSNVYRYKYVGNYEKSALAIILTAISISKKVKVYNLGGARFEHILMTNDSVTN